MILMTVFATLKGIIPRLWFPFGSVDVFLLLQVEIRPTASFDAVWIRVERR